jgi:hypothetical protein
MALISRGAAGGPTVGRSSIYARPGWNRNTPSRTFQRTGVAASKPGVWTGSLLGAVAVNAAWAKYASGGQPYKYQYMPGITTTPGRSTVAYQMKNFKPGSIPISGTTGGGIRTKEGAARSFSVGVAAKRGSKPVPRIGRLAVRRDRGFCCSSR